MPQKPQKTPIDAVITWVDGAHPAHRAKRLHYMAQSDRKIGENASNPHRWEASDEIQFCLRSLHHNAPWLRWIWIVVEQDGPDVSHLPLSLQQKIKIVRHAEIFSNFPDALPTFNSLAIETVLWQIEGLAERFLYFNDDVFLTAPLRPDDVFKGDVAVLRGAWRDYSHIAHHADPEDPALFNHFMHLNAARLGNVPENRLFAAAHVLHPMRRTIMAELYKTHGAAFCANVSHRFRDLSQFLPAALHNHACLAMGSAIIHPLDDHLHLNSGIERERSVAEINDLLTAACEPSVKILCVNDLPRLEGKIPDLRRYLDAAILGQPAPHATT